MKPNIRSYRSPPAPAPSPRSADALAHLAAIVDSSDDAIIGKTLEGVVTSWNAGAELIFGYAAHEMIGRSITVLIPRERAAEEDRILAAIRRGDRIRHYETVRLRKDGTAIDVSITVSPIKDASGRVIGASKIARDVTRRKRLEEDLQAEAIARKQVDDALAARAAEFKLVVEAAPNGMVMVDERGVITMANAQMERLFGYRREEMLGQPIEILLPERFRGRHPGLREGFYRRPEARPMGAGRDLYGRRKDGTEFPVEIGLNPAETPRGRVVLAAIIDITERKRTEETLTEMHRELADYARKLETAVAERTAHLEQTIAELEGVSYSLSHDMRAPLRTIQGFSQIVLADAGDKLDEPEKELLRKTIRAASRLDRLIQDVLTYTRVSRQSVLLGPVDVERLLRQIIDERPEFQPPRAEIAIAGPLTPIRGHEASLTQCITNLLDNAVKFVAPGRPPRVRIWNTVTDGRVTLCFDDNGIGIPQEAQARLFGIFERVHDGKAYPGTGIGLAIVRKAVERMGGRVWLESLPRGSRFCVQLPRAIAT